MKKTGFAVILFTVMLALLVTGCDNGTCIDDKGANVSTGGRITYSLNSHGEAHFQTTEYIDITFSRSVDNLDLVREDITITSTEGNITRGEILLQPGGLVCRVAVVVNWPGNVNVSINKPGIDTGVKTVMVHRRDVTYTVTPDGQNDNLSTPGVSTSKLVFEFALDTDGKPFPDFTADFFSQDIVIINSHDGGSINRTYFVKIDENKYEMGVAVNWRGEIIIRIDRLGFDPGDKPVDIRENFPYTDYYVTSDGLFGQNDSTKLLITFINKHVNETLLGTQHINIRNGSGAAGGAAEIGGILRSIDNQHWELPISDVLQGFIEFQIDRHNINDDWKPLIVHRMPITYDVTANGIIGFQTSTELTFTFSEDPDIAGGPLLASHITITGGTGSAVVDSISSGPGITRTATISGVVQGNILVAIDKRPVETAAKNVQVYRPIITIQSIAPDNTPATTALDFVFSDDPGTLNAGDFIITNNFGQATVGANVTVINATTRRLDINPIRHGDVYVRVNRPHIEQGNRSVLITYPYQSYTATQVGGTRNMTASTEIRITLSSDPGTLQLPVNIYNDSGIVVTGLLTRQSSTVWVMPITVVEPGFVNVIIPYGNIWPNPIAVEVYKPLTVPNLDYRVVSNGIWNVETTTTIIFTFDENVILHWDDITISNAVDPTNLGHNSGFAVKAPQSSASLTTVDSKIWELSVVGVEQGYIRVTLTTPGVSTTPSIAFAINESFF